MEEDRHLARATIGRRLSTVVGFYRFAVVGGHMAESPAQHIRRPKIDAESTTLGLDRMELGAFLAQAAAAGPVDHALACLLGLLGLRVSEACAIDIGHLGAERGHRTVAVVGKGAKVAVIPLPPRVARSVTWPPASAWVVPSWCPGPDSASTAMAPPASFGAWPDGAASASTSPPTR